MATFDPIFAADPDNPDLIAQNASITLFDPDDPALTPVTITDITGAPLPNPITVNSKGWGPAIKTPIGPSELFRLGWEGAGFRGVFTSYEGMRDATLAAKAAAEAAQSAAEGAATDAAAAATDQLAAAVAAAATSATSATSSAAAANAAQTAALAAQASAEDAASVTSGGGFAIDPANSNVLLITTLDDGTVAVDPGNPNVLLITT